MRRLRLICPLLGVLCVILFTESVTAATYHTYIPGMITSFQNNIIYIDKSRFILAPDVRIFNHVRRNGAYYEEKTRFSDVSVGQPVLVKVEGSTVYEILIERWKQ